MTHLFSSIAIGGLMFIGGLNAGELIQSHADDANLSRLQSRYDTLQKAADAFTSAPPQLVPARGATDIGGIAVDVEGGVHCLAFNDATGQWDRLRNPAEFMPQTDGSLP